VATVLLLAAAIASRWVAACSTRLLTPFDAWSLAAAGADGAIPRPGSDGA